MTDLSQSLERYRIPWKRDPLKQAAIALPLVRPVMRYAARHPALMIGAAVMGVAGMMAWRNRERIARTAEPMIEEARRKSQSLMEDAKVKGEALAGQAKTTVGKVAAKARTRRTAAAPAPLPDLH